MVGIDADVLSIYHVFKRDARYPATSSFMQHSKGIDRGVAIFGLLELCGVMASAGPVDAALKLFEGYHVKGDVAVLYPPIAFATEKDFWQQLNAEILTRVSRQMRLGDAAILWVFEASSCTAIVTWNPRHFAGKTTVKVQTPEEWLQERGLS